LSLSERDYIQSQLELGFKADAIATALKRAPLTVRAILQYIYTDQFCARWLFLEEKAIRQLRPHSIPISKML